MKVKTLWNAMMYNDIDEVELYFKNGQLASKMSPDTLLDCYGDFRVYKFNIHENIFDGWKTLELVFAW